MAADFSDTVRRWAKKAELATETAMQAAFIEVSQGTVQDTPRLDGYLIANWRCSANAPAVGVSTETDDESRSKTLEKIRQFVPQIGGNVVFFTNNSPYARRIEYEGWSKEKAPQGMINRNINNFVEAAERAIKKNKV